MKAKELMIGDWVQGFFPDTYSQIGQTTWNGSVIIFTRNGVEIDLNEKDVQPIPLTAEILEKNGWKKKEITSGYQYGIYIQYISPNKRVIANHFDTNSKKWGVHLDNENFSTIGYFECNYIHELQHILRLYGLNDLANNFKI